MCSEATEKSQVVSKAQVRCHRAAVQPHYLLHGGLFFQQNHPQPNSSHSLGSLSGSCPVPHCQRSHQISLFHTIHRYSTLPLNQQQVFTAFHGSCTEHRCSSLRVVIPRAVLNQSGEFGLLCPDATPCARMRSFPCRTRQSAPDPCWAVRHLQNKYCCCLLPQDHQHSQHHLTGIS